MSWEPVDDALLEEHQEAISQELAAIYMHLGVEAPDPEAPLRAILRHPSGSILYAIGCAYYALREGSGVRYRPLEEEMLQMTARREGELVGNAVIPVRSIFPEGPPAVEGPGQAP